MNQAKRFLLMIAFLVVSGGFVFAGPPVDKFTSWDPGDALVVDKSSPASYKMQIGSRLIGLIGMSSATTSSACATTVGACNTVATTETSMVTLKTTGAAWGESFALANGTPGQLKTYVLVTDGGKDFYITPTTKTGFTSAQLNDAKDSVTLRYVDDTVGWVVSGNNGATIN